MSFFSLQKSNWECTIVKEDETGSHVSSAKVAWAGCHHNTEKSEDRKKRHIVLLPFSDYNVNN